MAKITELRKTEKDIYHKSKTIAGYNMDKEFFSIWSYREKDTSGKGSASQNMQFDEKVAKVLFNALEEFLHGK